MTGNIDIAIYAEDKRLTLYPDENINLNQSVQSLKDLTKVFTDFTRSFSIPANDNNNAIFKHYYDAQIVNGFDARVKIEGRIEIGGVTLKTGKIQLNDVTLKSNVASDYKLEFFGNTVKIKDLIGDKTLRDLDLSALDHNYTPATIKTGLTNELFAGAIKYPLVSYNRRFLYTDIQQDTDSLINVKYDASFTSGVQWDELRPAIKCINIIEAIEARFPQLTFSRNFFDTQEFNQLYMSLGNGSDKQKPFSSLKVNEYNVNVFQRGGVNDRFRARLRAFCTVNSGVSEYRVVFLIDGERVYESDFVTGDYNASLNFGLIPFGVYKFEYFIESKGANNISVRSIYESEMYTIPFGVAVGFDLQDNTFVVDTLVPQVEIKSIIENMKIVDWFAAIVKSSNLVIVPENDGSLYVNTLSSWYDSGNILEVSEYVDIESLDVARGKLYRDINFGYEDQESLLANEYEAQFGQQFGGFESQVLGVSSEDKLEIVLPFENPQFERLRPSQNQYGLIVDNSLDSYKNKPFLFYIPNLPVSNDSRIGFSGDIYEPINFINTPSHSILINQGFAAQFNAEFSEYNGAVLDDNWYSRYYSDYINDLFNTRRREFTLNINFPISIASNLGLNDRLIIKGDRYLIDNIDTNLLNGVSKVVLLNDIFTTLSVRDESKLFESFITAKDRGSSYYTGAEFAEVSTESTFINLNQLFISSDDNLSFTLDANKTGVSRVGVIKVFDGLQNPIITVLQPSQILITFDEDIITFDNNKTTF